MTSQAIGDLTCSRGHRNGPSNRYCQYCGEKLKPRDPVEPVIVGDRYRVIRELGRGGFGHTYLAEDTNRFNEVCVLKEFAPELDQEAALEKAKELFSREAEVLYRLQHPQIPKFREWFMDDKLHALVLVQEYVLGPTYFSLLHERREQGNPFTEAEVIRFLANSLPILDYIHNQGVIHRDISPDNLICRQGDQLPILIDFGGVKQVTLTVETWSAPQVERRKNLTLIGKPAYAPEEQIRLGQVNPSSDVYALGVTALCLLTGKEPQDFFDAYKQTFNWRSQVQVQPHFAAVLDKMTAHRAADRYRSAAQALADLPEPPTPQSQVGTPPKTPQTLIVSPANPTATPVLNPVTPASPLNPHPVSGATWSRSDSAETAVVSPQRGSSEKRRAVDASRSPHPVLGAIGAVQRTMVQGIVTLVKGILVFSGVVGLGAVGWWIVQSRLEAFPDGGQDPPPESSAPAPQLSAAERDRRVGILDRMDQLQVPADYFNRVTNEAFYLQYPEQRGRLLNGTSPEDEALRSSWYDVAQEILDYTNQLTPPARSRLGQYQSSDLDRINQTLAQRRVNQRRFFRDIDRNLTRRLPMYRDQSLDQLQANQLRLALALVRLQS
ncbi:protein kinase domain-containing protein [Lyngbya confervoides]|uniref:non-specific serine/threonine protein kinase n=1 Tax=Lyngbya confervoides BDU141951 TaxID=1574623 RepID=A0ABD4T8M7_9CYAN|nr:protein kinase [Lyngbya confervoides]MCM1984884.1 protein kinase [Lyngbya confervoides BDU141951]